MKYKIIFSALLALLAMFMGVAMLGATGRVSYAFHTIAAVALAAWFGWMIRDCDGK